MKSKIIEEIIRIRLEKARIVKPMKYDIGFKIVLKKG